MPRYLESNLLAQVEDPPYWACLPSGHVLAVNKLLITPCNYQLCMTRLRQLVAVPCVWYCAHAAAAGASKPCLAGCCVFAVLAAAAMALAAAAGGGGV